MTLVVRQPHADRCFWLGRARAVQGRPLVHVAVHAVHGHIPATICNHLQAFATIRHIRRRTGPCAARCLSRGIRAPPGAPRAAQLVLSILEQKFKENSGMAPFAAA